MKLTLAAFVLFFLLLSSAISKCFPLVWSPIRARALRSWTSRLSDARLQGVYVPAIDNLDRPPKARLEADRRLLGELGGTLREVRAGDPASGLIRAARKAGACQLVIGSRRRSRWSRLLTGSTVADQVLRAAGDLPVQVVNVGRPDKTSDEWRRPGHDARQHRTA